MVDNCWFRVRILRFICNIALLSCLSFFSFSCSAQQDFPTYGEPLAAVSPDGRWFLLSEAPDGQPQGTWLKQTKPQPGSSPIQISGNIRDLNIGTVWSRNSKRYLTYHGNMLSQPTDSLELHDVSDGSSSKILTPEGVTSAAFSPDGLLVAFETVDMKLAVNYLAVWNPAKRGKDAVKYFAFNNDIEGFTWLNRHSLFVITPGVRHTPKYEFQNFYRIDLKTRKISTIPYRVTTKVSVVWPYLDGADKILAIAGSSRQLTEAHESGYERLIEIDPKAGTEKHLGRTCDISTDFWLPLPSGSGQTVLLINVYSNGKETVYTRTIDGAHGIVGEPVQWNVTSEPSVDSAGRIFGWLGSDAGYAVPVKLESEMGIRHRP
jgi:dipeptidyl aminopeptidase/acylaminoacyl peptidase